MAALNTALSMAAAVIVAPINIAATMREVWCVCGWPLRIAILAYCVAAYGV